MADINDIRKAHLEALSETLPVKTFTQVSQVREPKNIEWAVQLLTDGNTMEEVRALAGLNGQKGAYLWRAFRQEILTYQMPPDELTALTKYYIAQEDRIAQLEADIADLDRRIAAGPNDRVARNSQGKEFVVEDKGFNLLLKYRIDARKMLIDETQKQYQAFLDQRKAKAGAGKYQGATIHIHSNVPRPTLKEVDKIEGEDE